MAPRANWKGYLAIAALTCPVALYTAASTAERIAFHTLNRKTGNRVHRQFVDVVTREPVPPEAQIKGYEIHPDEYVAITPDEIAASLPEHDKTLSVESFVPCDAIDESYFDRPYYLAPQDQVAVQAFAVVRDAMREAGVAALARATLSRRVRHLLIYPQNAGLIARSLHFNYEIRA